MWCLTTVEDHPRNQLKFGAYIAPGLTLAQYKPHANPLHKASAARHLLQGPDFGHFLSYPRSAFWSNCAAIRGGRQGWLGGPVQISSYSGSSTSRWAVFSSTAERL